MRQQYHFRKVSDQIHIWDVNKLLSTIKIESIKLSLDIFKSQYNSYYWTEEKNLTCEDIANHSKLIYEADLSYPILVCSEYQLIDGMHRLCKAFINGDLYISTIVLENLPSPDFIDVRPEDLIY